MQPITTNGAPVTSANSRYSSGISARPAAVSAAAIAKLIHHGDRNRIANSELSFICHFMRCLAALPGAENPQV